MTLKFKRNEEKDLNLRKAINESLQFFHSAKFVESDNAAVNTWNTYFYNQDIYYTDEDVLDCFVFIFSKFGNNLNAAIIGELLSNINTLKNKKYYDIALEKKFSNLPKLKTLTEKPKNRDISQLDKSFVSDGIDFIKFRVENTNSCKYTCEMCPREKMTRPTGIMSKEDYQFLLNRINEYWDETNNTKTIDSKFYLHGYGEPLFDQNLAAKSAMVAEQFPDGKSYIFTTLGVKRPKSYMESLLVDGKLKNIVVSLYGFQEHTYSAIHTGGNYKTVRENLLNLAKRNKSLGNPCNIVIHLLLPYTLDVMDNDPSEKKAYDELLEILFPLGVTVRNVDLHNYGNGRDYNDPQADKSVCSVVGGTKKLKLNVSWDLNVLPCCFDYNADIVFGNLREQSIFEIYHSDAYNKFQDAHWTGNLEDYPLCQGCDKR